MNTAVPPAANRCQRCQAELPPGKDAGHCTRCLLELAMRTDAGASARTTEGGGRPPSIEALQPLLPAYELQALLGRGGMGAVYRARHKKLDRLVAIKVLLEDLVRDPAFAERFEREARALAMLKHPGIVGVHDFGRAGDFYFLVMEYVDGASLRDLLQSGRLSTRDVLAFVPQLCDALQYAHDHRVVHRDIKPENILVDQEGRVHIADFGLAKLASQESPHVGLTRTEQVLGTPLYMAPEQIGAAGSVDHRADLYSLGVVLYEMLTGSLPIGRFEPPSAKAHDARSFDPVVMRSLASDPAQRYQQAREVKHDVEAAGGPTPANTANAGASPPAAAAAAAKWIPLLRPWIGAAAVFLATFADWIGVVPGAGSSYVGIVYQLGGPPVADAWHASFLAVPAWLVFPLALAVGGFGTLRVIGWPAQRWLPVLLTFAGALFCGTLIASASSSDTFATGLGPRASVVVFSWWFVIELRRCLVRRGTAAT